LLLLLLLLLLIMGSRQVERVCIKDAALFNIMIVPTFEAERLRGVGLLGKNNALVSVPS
jgi:hypothetical protein